MLHTYGDLSDAQLLQTYGFVDLDSETHGSKETAAETAGKKRKAPAHPGLGSKAQVSEQKEEEEWVNPYNHGLVPMSALMETSRAVAKDALGVEVGAEGWTRHACTPPTPLTITHQTNSQNRQAAARCRQQRWMNQP